MTDLGIGRLSAEDIYQANLDAVTAGIVNDDFGLLSRHLAVPLLLMSGTSQIVLSTASELQAAIARYGMQLREKGVIHYRRSCLAAEFQPGDPTMIFGTHRTEMICADGPLMAPYQAQLVLMRIDGLWKAIWQQAFGDESRFPFLDAEAVERQRQAHALMAARAAADAVPAVADGDR